MTYYILYYIAAPLRWLTSLCGGWFAPAVFLFTIVINAVMLPLTIKSQKATAAQARIKPKMDALKAKYGDDQQKYNQAVQELYQKENVKMSGGCLPLLVRMVFLFAVYAIVFSPLSYIMTDGLANAKTKAVYDNSQSIVSDLGYGREFTLINKIQNGSVYKDLEIAKNGGNEKKDGKIKAIKKDKYNAYVKFINESSETVTDSNIKFHIFSKNVDMLKSPKFSLDVLNSVDVYWLFPFVAFLAQFLNSLITLRVQKKQNPDAQQMKALMLMMPLMSLWLGFTLPAAFSFYWICSTIIGGAIQLAVQQKYNPGRLVAEDEANYIITKYKDEKAKMDAIEK